MELLIDSNNIPGKGRMIKAISKRNSQVKTVNLLLLDYLTNGVKNSR